ncbi:MAG: hypothetical protein ABR970_15830 [Roseiarcus sp.]|jgi:hypothetical protein
MSSPIYEKQNPTVRRRGVCKAGKGRATTIETPTAANQRWSLHFVADQMTNGRRCRPSGLFLVSIHSGVSAGSGDDYKNRVISIT